MQIDADLISVIIYGVRRELTWPVDDRVGVPALLSRTARVPVRWTIDRSERTETNKKNGASGRPDASLKSDDAISASRNRSLGLSGFIAGGEHRRNRGSFFAHVPRVIST